jgi:predicted Zn-dependent peptidase
MPRISSRRKRLPFSGYRPAERSLTREVKQARCALGRTAFSLSHPKRSTLFLLTNILGGGGLNSRLNLSLREKYGFVYSIGAHFVPFTDTGLFVISFGTEPTQLERSIRLVNDELRKLRDGKLGVRQLSSAKEQILGQVAMAEESNLSFMMMMGRSLLDLGRVSSLDEIFSRIRDTTAEDLRNMAVHVFDEGKISCLRMEPKNKTS